MFRTVAEVVVRRAGSYIITVGYHETGGIRGRESHTMRGEGDMLYRCIAEIRLNWHFISTGSIVYGWHDARNTSTYFRDFPRGQLGLRKREPEM